jgi:methyl-accepting chemotaxis protein
MDMISVLTGQEQKIQPGIYARVFAGESFELTQTFTYEGVDTHVILSYSPLRNESREVYAAAVYAKDVTALVNAQKRAEQLMRESQNLPTHDFRSAKKGARNGQARIKVK